MLATIVDLYWAIALIVFLYWLVLFASDRNISKLDLTSWIILSIGPLFWPIILPISSWELNRKTRKNILF